MTNKYTSEQFWKLYDKLPQELKDALFAEETGTNIYDTCKRNDCLEYHSEIIEYVGQVLIGVLAPEDFMAVLKKNLKLTKETAKKVVQEINRFIFYPVRPLLEKLYKMKMTPSSLEKPGLVTKTPAPKKEESAPPRKDTYREPIK